MKRLVLILAISGAFCAHAQVAIVLDISGTMGQYGYWQQDAINVCRSLSANSSNPDLGNWEAKGDLAAYKPFQTASSKGLVFIPFGSTQSDAYPFFAGIRVLAASEEISSYFPPEKNFNQGKTNKPLAAAVAGTKVADSTGTAYVILISDFMVDSSLTAQQEAFVNGFEAKTKLETPLILSWRKNPRVQIKFLKYRDVNSSSVSVPELAGTIELFPAQFRSDPRRTLDLHWRSTANRAVQSYNVLVTDKSTGQTLFSKSDLVLPRVSVPDPRAGRLNWRVIALYADGSQSGSVSQDVVVPESREWASMIIVLLVIGGIAACGWWLLKRSSGIPEWLMVWKRKKADWS